MPKQRCPACGKLHDVGIFVSGQQVRCSFCGLPFTVERSDSQVLDPEAFQVSEEIKPAKPVDTLPKAPPSDGDTAAGSDGLFIPGYEIYEMLGKGGMGRVYRARQISLDRLVAIKVLSDDLAKHRSFIRRFEKESGALAALNHPNITTIIDRGHVGNLYYFVMEYVGGLSLRQKMNRSLMKLKNIIGIAVDLCKALDHAHERGVIHRDLKPENVLFTPDDVLKVADFGLANIVGPDKRWELTRTKVSMGTVNYMAPEQRRDAKHVDNRADIYSLGVMLYEMLVRELPLGRFDSPSSRRTDVDQRLDQLVLKMLDFEPDRRPQQAKLVAAHLESIFGAARAPTPGKKPKPEPLPDSREESLPVAEPAPEDDNQKLSTMVSSPDHAKKRPRGLRRIPGMVLPVAGSVFLLLLAVAGVVAFLLYRGIENTPGDLVLHNSEGNFQLKTSNLSLVKYLAPAQSGQQSGRQMLRFDFQPSSLPVVPVTFQRGNWQTQRGRLVQDSCQNGFTINQIPARASFGQDEVKPEGLELKVKLTARPASYRPPDGPEMSLEQFMRQILGGARQLLPLRIDYRVGLGFFNREGHGLEVLLPLNGPSQTGRLDRHGEDMEGNDHDFPAAADLFNRESIEIRLTFSQGQLSLYAKDQLLLNELAGFPLEFSGLPAVACQNARCTIHSLEISRR